MPRFMLVDEVKLKELKVTVDRTSKILSSLLETAGELSLPDSLREDIIAPSAEDARVTSAHGSATQYRISRAEWGYVDVVDREVLADEFSLDDAWEILRPLILTDAKRPRDSLRTALERSENYQRIRGRSGIWWRRIRAADSAQPQGDFLGEGDS